MPPENVFTSVLRRSHSSNSFSSVSMRSARGLARHVIEHAVQLHVLVGGQLAVEARVLEHDAEALAHLVRLAPRDRARRCAMVPLVGCSSVVSIWIVVVLPAPFGPRNAKISPARHVERDAVDGLDLAEGLDQVLDVNHGERYRRS